MMDNLSPVTQWMSGPIVAANLQDDARNDFEALALYIETDAEFELIFGPLAKARWSSMIRNWLSGEEAIDALDIDKLAWDASMATVHSPGNTSKRFNEICSTAWQHANALWRASAGMEP